MLPRKGARFALEDIRRAIAEKLVESETLEYKSEPGRGFDAIVAKAVTAFANSGGGTLVLGIGETAIGEPTDTSPPGLANRLNSMPTSEQIDRWIRTKVFPNPPALVDSVEIEGTDRVYVIVTVGSRGGAYRIVNTGDPALNGRYYVRRGRESVEADHYQLRALFAEAEDVTVRVRQYLQRRGLDDEASADFGTRGPFRNVPTVTWTPAKTLESGRNLEINAFTLDHAVAAYAIPDVLRGDVIDTTDVAVRDAVDPAKNADLVGFGYRREPTLEGIALTQRQGAGSLVPGSYLEVHRTGYVEASHCYAGVVYDGRRFLDAGAALRIAKTVIAVAARIRAIAGQTDRLLIGLAVRNASLTTLFAYDPRHGTASTLYPHIVIEQVADASSLTTPLELLRRFDERLGNAYGQARTDALQEDGDINRMTDPLTGRV